MLVRLEFFKRLVMNKPEQARERLKGNSMVSLTTYNRSACQRRENEEEEKNSLLGSIKLSKVQKSGAEQ